MRQFRNTPYLVSEDGNVYRKGKSTALKADVMPKGYRRVTLSIQGKTERFFVHRMVAEIYLVKGPDDVEVNHKDLVPGHDWKDNLEWTTKSGNQLHAISMGKTPYLNASKAASAAKFAVTEKFFREKLGLNFIRVINENPRNFVEFYCSNCPTKLVCRTDSSTLRQTNIMCRPCQYKMKI
jgi:hypothetical protein